MSRRLPPPADRDDWTDSRDWLDWTATFDPDPTVCHVCGEPITGEPRLIITGNPPHVTRCPCTQVGAR